MESTPSMQKMRMKQNSISITYHKLSDNMLERSRIPIQTGTKYPDGRSLMRISYLKHIPNIYGSESDGTFHPPLQPSGTKVKVYEG